MRNFNKSKEALEIFRDTCQEFDEIIRQGLPDMPRSGWKFTKLLWFSFRHPFKNLSGLSGIVKFYRKTLKINQLDATYPIEPMLSFLQGFDSKQLNALKKLTEVNLRKHKENLTDNPMFKIIVLVGAIYSILKGGSFIFEKSHVYSLISQIAQVKIVQLASNSILIGLIIGLIIVVIQFVISSAPNLMKARLLDDIIMIELQNRTLLEKADSKTET